ncbi:MAG: PRC-barrel domain-containing protein [Roseovarius sp.]
MEKNTKTTDLNAEEVTNFLKLPVYTRDGTYVGHVRNIFLDLDEKKVSSLLVTDTNPSLVEGTIDVAVPYRWVNSVGDIVILSHFPNRVTTRKREEDTEAETKKDIDMIE